ncbi:unnamed protein product [Rotaria sordida]|uniref:Protein-tyrosine-phosphatase n=1 Tax=Rotaria sordida TaxID=392033 RepID=A0A815BFI0_9BILA|nr:unnamed protein product [Rotaria sordida]CAF1272914.1 unnamed protein product [Rotaria sordida]CAF1495126.1 unnamed protein product [Rotaria sordida]CAF1515949.1 unnamed protein product [Rotaria sordida]CAF1660141.1 unnamed protein product [Rotaria sordida]
MGQGMSEILPDVYVTSAIVARQGKVLDEFGITHVISIQAKPISPFNHREYLLITAKDHISQDLLQYAAQCNDFIHNARLNRGKVLIHCVEGKSRSPSIACIYVMTITGISWSDTINSLRGVRTLVDPNFAFQRQLKYFYDQHMVQERERLCMKFGPFNMIDDDIAFVMKNLALYNEEQRRLTGKFIDIDQLHISTKNDTTISSSDNDKTKNINETNSDLDEFFQNSDLSSMTPESQSLLDEMFSS